MAQSHVPSVFDPGFPAMRRDPFLSLHREVNRLFDDMMRGADAATSQPPAAIVPSIDVSESGHDIRVEAELPGVSEQDVHVELAGEVLTIRGTKRSTRQDAQHHLTERSFGSFARSVRLPFAPKPDQVRASFTNGVLTIVLPKAAAETRVHHIQVHAADGAGQSLANQGDAAAAGHPTPATTQPGTHAGKDGTGQ